LPRILRDKQFRMTSSSGRASVAVCGIEGQLEVLDSRTLAPTRTIDLNDAVPASFFTKAKAYGTVVGNEPARLTGKILFQLRSLVTAGTDDYRRFLLGGHQRRSVLVGDPGTRLRVMEVMPDEVSVSAMALSPDGTLGVAGGYDSVCTIFDVNNGEILCEFREHERVEQGLHIEWAEFCPTGTRVATTNEGSCIVWDPRNGAAISETSDCSFARFSPDGESILLTDRKHCIIWKFLKNECVHCGAHDASIVAGAWSCSGEEIVTGDYKGNVSIWRAATGKHIDTIALEDASRIRDICWTEAGILALSESGIVSLI